MSALITLVRHGRTAHNAAGRFQGWRDVPLDEAGQAQAKLVAARLARLEIRPTKLISSDLLRTQQTAEAVGEALNLPVSLAPSLREINVGAWEGLTFEEVKARWPDEYARWPLEAAPGGETLRQVGERLRAFFDGLNPEEHEHVVLVSHGAAITALLCELLGWDLAQTWAERRGEHQNTAITTLELGGDVPHCHTLACAAHLEAERA